MQGAFAEHIRALEACGARTRVVRSAEDLDGLDGIVLPGGESTTMTMLMDRVGLAVAYSKVTGRSGIRDDGIAGMLSYRF